MVEGSDPDPRDTDPGVPPAGSDTVGSKLSKALGKEVDPGVSLDGGPAPSVGRSSALDSLVGKDFKWGRYEHQDEVARGGMGAILKVWDGNLRRQLAMKVLLRRGGPKDGTDAGASVDEVDPKLLSRFLEEAQVTGQLDHPGVVPVHELGLDENGAIYFTMRLVKGRELAAIFELVREGTEGWNQTRALGVMLKVCEAMAYAHTKGVIHRDLKPANIMVGRFGEVYVMDWGLARVVGKPDLHDVRVDSRGSDSSLDVLMGRPVEGPDLRTMDGDIVGTPAYMAPEQARGKVSELGPRSDVYAVGAMLYELLAGTPPYIAPGEKPSPVTVLLRVREGPPDPLAIMNPDVPGELEAICEKAMAREESERYEDMQDLAEDLRAYLEHRVVKAYERGAIAEIRKWIARNKAFATASAVALALLVIGLAVSAMLYVRAEHSAKLAETRRKEAVANEQKALANEELAMSEKERADESAARARRNEELAIARRAEAEAERVKVLRLSDVKRLATLEADAARLWPATPDQLPKYEAWLERAELLRSRLELHREALTELRAGAIASSDDPDDPEWTFASTEERWQHDVLSELVMDLEEFTSDTGLIADVRSRVEFAETVRERTITGPDAARRWAEAIEAIADPATTPAYAGLELTPQLGLLPIGPDPESGLWEFVHVQTGDLPERDADGHLIVTEETGIVLVLLPDGAFLRGAQSSYPDEPNYDPRAAAHESPVEEIALDAFFISKFEMTQGQWLRFTGHNPSNYNPGTKASVALQLDLTNPVEQVSWQECSTVLANMGLALPTEAQWEYATRAGTQTPWWTGTTRDTLVGAGNFADQSAARAGATWAAINAWPELDDGFPFHAPVGSFRASPFGLYDVHGNVFEWCEDWYGPYGQPLEEGTGLREALDYSYHIYRGGGFLYADDAARSAYRDGNVPDYKGSSVGVRPARPVKR